ncbi:MAG: thiamine phosphate synthase [Proteobacteria bacterium]|nr:thiamine phosphate synthase [Pseudomonadota bacterium]MDA1021735.1 thiamine phosphate synthase [Pseudomonadota bacterium]
MMTLSDLTRCLNFAAPQRPQRIALPRLILMTDEARLPDPHPAIDALPAGSAVIFRHYDTPGRAALAQEVVNHARARRVRVLVAGDPRLAVKVGADGLHLPEAMARRGPGAWRTWFPGRGEDGGGAWAGWLITAAAHSPAALRRAETAGADAVLLSPVFPSQSHPDAAHLGNLRFRALCAASRLPVYALGGVTKATARRLRGSGAAGLAGIGFLYGQH